MSLTTWYKLTNRKKKFYRPAEIELMNRLIAAERRQGNRRSARKGPYWEAVKVCSSVSWCPDT